MEFHIQNGRIKLKKKKIKEKKLINTHGTRQVNIKMI